MRRIILVSSFLFIWTFSFGQHYYSKDIIKKADSIMKATVGERIFKKYLHYDSSSYYECKNFWGKTSWKTLTDIKRTKGKFKSMVVRYLFCLDTFNIPCFNMQVKLDSTLNKISNVDTYFIPEYILNNSNCNFITDTTALNIAKSKFTLKGIEPISARLDYDYNKRLFIWTMRNTLTKDIDRFGKDCGIVQIVVIDAFTGEIISFYPNALYGPVY